MEGVLRSYRTDWHGGHYTLELAKVIEGESRTVTLDGGRVRVPRENVVFVQELHG